jgi:phosphatidylinositol alpha-1,6-mannosyltransferase
MISSRQSIFLIAWEFSRHGGIEEVSRQVSKVLHDSDRYCLKKFRFPKSNKLVFLYKLLLKIRVHHGCIFFFMHPYIFEKLSDLFSSTHAPPTIVWAHGIEVWGRFGKEHAPSLPSATKIIASSHFTRDRILENFPTADVSVARLAVNTEPSFCSAKQNMPFEILTVGRLAENEKYKGHDLVLRALAILKLKNIYIKYHIVGFGSDFPRLKDLVQNFHLSKQVVFHGYLPDPQTNDIYAKCSAFVMPSHVVKRDNEIWSGEGFGLVYLEAALHGLPVIACDEGGQCDCIVDGQTGFLVPPDPKIIADRLEWLAINRNAGIQMGERGRSFVLGNHMPEHFRSDVLEVVDQAIKKKAYA